MGDVIEGLRASRRAGAVLAIVVLASGCGSSDESATVPPQPSAAPSAIALDGAATAAPSPSATEPSQVSTPAPAPTTETLSTPEPTPIATAPSVPPAASVPRVANECRLEPNAPGPVGDTQLSVEVVAEGLEVPWGLAVLPDGDLLVTERPGRVRLIEDAILVPESVVEPRVELPPPLFGIDRLGPEGGLLGVVLHPDFATNRLFYLFYNLVNDAGEFIGRVERYELAFDGRSAESDRVILDDLPAGVHHQGGRMHLGPDGMLYVGVGAFEPSDAQDPDSLAGKLLRLDLDGDVPSDNPDPSSYVYVSGIRNSQGFDWIDDQHLVVVDHGPSGLELDLPDLRGFDEINIVRAGDNLGWPRVWGCDQAEGLVAPVLSWNASVPPTGGLMYRGDAIAEWTGNFLFTTVGRDFGQHLHRVVFDDEAPYDVIAHETYLLREYGRLRTVAAAPDGGIYVMTSNCDGRGLCPSRGDVILHVTGAGR